MNTKPIKFKYEYDEDDYYKTHVIFHNKYFHIYWNNFRKPYETWGLKWFGNQPHGYSFAVYFGRGEFVIQINTKEIK